MVFWYSRRGRPSVYSIYSGASGHKEDHVLGASEQRLPSGCCPPRHSHPLSPFWGPQPWPWHWLAQGSRDGDQERPSGPEMWPSLAAAQPSLQEQPGPTEVPILPSGSPADPGGVWGARSALPAPPCRSTGGERQRGGAGLLPPCPQPSPGETASPASETGPRADSTVPGRRGAPSLGRVGMRPR